MSKIHYFKDITAGIAAGLFIFFIILLFAPRVKPQVHCYEEIVTSIEVDTLPSGMYRIHYHK